jgi:hypothetical protein
LQPALRSLANVYQMAHLPGGVAREIRMAELSRDEVVAIVGPIGDVAVAEIIATGITKDELIAAHDRVVKDLQAHNPGQPLEPGPIAQTIRILERLRVRGILGEAGSTLE